MMIGMPNALARRRDLPLAEPSLLAITCDAASLDEALRLFELEGIAPGRVNILARGADLERRWLRDRELCRMGERPAPDDRPLGAYARKIADGPRLLLEGCWAMGPLFLGKPGGKSSQAIGSLGWALMRAGISLRDAISTERAVQRDGMIWLAVEEKPGILDAVLGGSRLPLLQAD